MFSRGERFAVEIISTGFEGKSIAKHNDIVIFVDGGVEGDFAEIEITKTKKKYAEAKIIDLKNPSVNRIEPKCKHFGSCGGCKYQHVNYSEQLKFKRQHVLDSLERIGNLKNVQVFETLPSPEIYFYRNKMEFSFGLDRWLTAEEILTDIKRAGFYLGFHAPQRYNRIIDVVECHLESDLSNKILNFVKNYSQDNNLEIYNSETQTGYLRNLVIREGKNTGDVMVNLVTFLDLPDVMKKFCDALVKNFREVTTVINNINSRRAQIAVGDREKIYFGSGTISEKLNGINFQISANSFFQTNTHQSEILFNVVKDFAELKKEDVVYDLYCGTGSIALTIAKNVKEVIGIELIESSIENAKKNQQANGITNCTFIASDLKDLLTKNFSEIEHFGLPSCIILDPPRNGLHQKIIEEICKFKTPKIIYVSCNPATLARDLKLFAEFGYEITKVQPVDMFPHTYHIESVAQLQLTFSN